MRRLTLDPCAGRSRAWSLLAAALRQQVPSTSLPVLQQLQALLGRWGPPKALQQELEGLLRATCRDLQDQQGREGRCEALAAGALSGPSVPCELLLLGPYYL